MFFNAKVDFVLFAFIGMSIFLFCLAVTLNLPELRLVIKAVPVALMAFGVQRFAFASLVKRWMVIGLLLGASGDLLLEWPKPDLFLFGLVFFICAHLAYLCAFWNVRKNQERSLNILFLVLLYIASLLTALIKWGQVGELTIPVVLYGGVIAMMLWRALMIGGLAGWGAVFFVLSDSLLAIDRFWFELPGRDYWVNGTYWLAQGYFFVWAIRETKSS